MSFKVTYIIRFSILACLTWLLQACSQESNSLISRGWHNLNARDNSFFLARERTKEIEKDIDLKTPNDYNKVLYPLAVIDTDQTKSYKDKTDNIIKLASIPITRHKNSEYVDNSYILVGKSRVLRGEWKLALETFKFVNGQGDPDERHEALIQLMRLFILKKDYRSAGSVDDYLRKQPLNDKNKRDFMMTDAQYFRILEDYNRTLVALETAVPLVKGKHEKRARVYFIIAQIYQLLGKDSMAYVNYRKTIKNNPPYELSFYAKLYLAQVTSLGNSSDRKRVERYFRKLLKDKKNLEYRDKIYYEMALFEYKQKNIPKAISYLEKSVQENRGNKYQKGSSYLKLGEIYYNDQKDYETSKLYYDSTVAVWDRNDKRYREIAERQKILDEFVKNLLIVRREDSLQRLAKMDTATLSKFIDKVIQQEEEEKARLEKQALARKKAEEQKQQQGPQIINNSVPGDPSNWYFYNDLVVSRGASDFKVKWGGRKLEDNWRRSTKEVVINDPATAPEDTVEVKDTVKTADKKVADKEKYYADIPFTPEQLQASDEKIQQGLYNLGRIYNLKLDEKENAIESFEDLLRRYPQYKDAAEVMYFLYLINKDLGKEDRAEYYKQRLISEYPGSLYAKILKNPNYIQENKEMNKHVAFLYKAAFDMYDRKDYNGADSMLVSLMKIYPENDILDKMKLLRIMITGHTKNALVYKQQLEEFINDKNNEFSTTLPKARELLARSDEYLQAQTSKGTEVRTSDVKYNTNTSKPHYFVVVLEEKKVKKEVALKKINDYTRSEFRSAGLTAFVAKVSDTTFAIVVKTFDAMYPARQYREKITEEAGFLEAWQSKGFATFYITEDNYKLFYGDKNVNTYLEFFNKNY